MQMFIELLHEVTAEIGANNLDSYVGPYIFEVQVNAAWIYLDGEGHGFRGEPLRELINHTN